MDPGDSGTLDPRDSGTLDLRDSGTLDLRGSIHWTLLGVCSGSTLNQYIIILELLVFDFSIDLESAVEQANMFRIIISISDIHSFPTEQNAL